MGDEEDYFKRSAALPGDKPARKPSLQSRLQNGMHKKYFQNHKFDNLIICYLLIQNQSSKLIKLYNVQINLN